jgi:vancomycin permeability regulator SanA
MDAVVTAAHDDWNAGRERERRLRRTARRILMGLILLAVLAALGPRVVTWIAARGDIAHEPTDIPKLTGKHHRAAIVLGAGLKGDDPSPLLDDRIKAAVKLLQQHRVDVLIMSGDNSTEYYDEPTAMRTRAIKLGAAPSQVAPDYAGRRTWDSCVRAHEIFGLDEAVVVTSAFHVDRSVVSCSAAGVDATGYSVPDDRFSPKHRAVWRTRELAATGRALVDAWIVRPGPAVGGKAIDPWDPCAIEQSLAPSDAARDKLISGTECTE